MPVEGRTLTSGVPMKKVRVGDLARAYEAPRNEARILPRRLYRDAKATWSMDGARVLRLPYAHDEAGRKAGCGKSARPV